MISMHCEAPSAPPAVMPGAAMSAAALRGPTTPVASGKAGKSRAVPRSPTAGIVGMCPARLSGQVAEGNSGEFNCNRTLPKKLREASAPHGERATLNSAPGLASGAMVGGQAPKPSSAVPAAPVDEDCNLGAELDGGRQQARGLSGTQGDVAGALTSSPTTSQARGASGRSGSDCVGRHALAGLLGATRLLGEVGGSREL
mmetsp:Transcript_3198/g.9069  ORF Transcript_3198/g.9069 Transcript_3198/m.9069 type:complete len:200 (+) Transcript_3198:90-689(+)